jgi:hypothetical protein
MGTLEPTQDLRTALSTFVKTIQAASPDAQISLTECGGAAVTTVKFTTDTARLEAGINRLVPAHQSNAVVLEALMDASKQIADEPAPRRAIVTISFNSSEGSANTPQKVAEAVHRSGATLWAISIQGTIQDGIAGSAPNREQVLNELPRVSGGLHLTAVSTTSLESMLKGVANNLLSQYTVTFVRPGTAPIKTIRAETTGGASVLLSPWMR